MQSLRCEGLLHLAVELAFDDHVDEPRAEPHSPGSSGCGPATFLPVEDKGEALLGARDRPAERDATGRTRKAAVLAGIGRKPVDRHAHAHGPNRLDEDV